MKAHSSIISFTISLIFLNTAALYAACPLDHFEIGRNADGIWGTTDDLKLFIDCGQIYRHSDPADNQNPTWRYWHYPLYYSVIYHNYTIGEPGFDTIKADDPNHCLTGTPLVDYNIVVECVSISTGLTASYTGYPSFTLTAVGDYFSHSGYTDPHLHMTYRAPTNDRLYWITFRMYDTLGEYEPSDDFTLVFIKDPLDGDLAVDGVVDWQDMTQCCGYWLFEDGSRINDFYQRADMNRDAIVNFVDFSLLAANWLKSGTK